MASNPSNRSNRFLIAPWPRWSSASRPTPWCPAQNSDFWMNQRKSRFESYPVECQETQILDMFRIGSIFHDVSTFQHFNSCQSFQSSNDLQSAGALLFPLAQLASTASTPLVLSLRLPSADHKRPKPLRTSNIFEPTKGTFTTTKTYQDIPRHTKTYQDNPRPSWLPYQVIPSRFRSPATFAWIRHPVQPAEKLEQWIQWIHDSFWTQNDATWCDYEFSWNST